MGHHVAQQHPALRLNVVLEREVLARSNVDDIPDLAAEDLRWCPIDHDAGGGLVNTRRGDAPESIGGEAKDEADQESGAALQHGPQELADFGLRLSGDSISKIPACHVFPPDKVELKNLQMDRFKAYVVLAVFASSGAACVSGGPAPRAVTQPVVHSVLGSGDVFEVRVFQEADLSGSYRVDETGNIDFPLIGRVMVVGRLPSEVAEDLRSRLRFFVRSPQVSLFVRETNSRRVIVYGQVQHPGTFPYTQPMTVSQAISLAGGFATMAARDKVRVLRIEGERQSVIDVNVRSIVEGKDPNQYLFPGDEVYVPDRLF